MAQPSKTIPACQLQDSHANLKKSMIEKFDLTIAAKQLKTGKSPKAKKEAAAILGRAGGSAPHNRPEGYFRKIALLGVKKRKEKRLS